MKPDPRYCEQTATDGKILRYVILSRRASALSVRLVAVDGVPCNGRRGLVTPGSVRMVEETPPKALQSPLENKS